MIYVKSGCRDSGLLDDELKPPRKDEQYHSEGHVKRPQMRINDESPRWVI